MHVNLPTPWPETYADAVAMQNTLRSQVIVVDQLENIRHVAGLDVGLEADKTHMRAAVVVLDFPTLARRAQALARRPAAFPYIPGLLSFREVPALVEALEKLAITPDLLLCDGQGLAHPRRFGIACHLGVLTGLPAIGVAKSLLVGQYENLPDVRGAWRPLLHQEEVVGAALRTRRGVSPVYVSIGHRISLETALDYVMRCCTKYRLPETTRLAHGLASGPMPSAAHKVMR
jgi:deoxyribonuclease V